MQALKLIVNMQGCATDHTRRALFDAVLCGTGLSHIFKRLFVTADIDWLQAFDRDTEAANIACQFFRLGIALSNNNADR
ncbi:hypothetical protein D3C80_507440 [compost metagenome]